MAGGETLLHSAHVEPSVECPYCGVRVTLMDSVGQWVQTCTRTPGHSAMGGLAWVEPRGCGKSFVVTQTRRVVHTTSARKIEGEA
ncbi:hypothetical protein C7H84_30255 [Burkholderia sp. Nafp2/4-1b]|uniref:hypothetical protein n=1 Tax=Burkholderia sp. Nafp2/4-1b TaxID=2116686 RepID=UPI000F260157|nr:hypothetical protein [Burkholderia sp. Nafp2/4-1b]RKT99561.1 hypothetical protein C7H84_30255 [Burkholderia sp. Nafp2/4-1b]